MNAHVRAVRARLLYQAGRISFHAAVQYVLGGMEVSYLRDWPQAAHDWAVSLVNAT